MKSRKRTAEGITTNELVENGDLVPKSHRKKTCSGREVCMTAKNERLRLPGLDCGCSSC